ncbi:MAG: hypothetical protein ACXIUZ_01565 [Lysobacteraceae bacterium]
MNNPLLLSLSDIERSTGQSRPVIHDAVNAGHLETFLIGRRRFARPECVRAWVDFLEQQSKAGKPVCYRSREALGDKRGGAR